MSFPKNDDRAKHAADLFQQPIHNALKSKGISPNAYEVYLRAFKQEKLLEVWVKNKPDTSWQLFTTYDFCASSGVLGPKRKEGDLQIPEGFYYIDRYNPKSNFHLSLGLNYPNAADKMWSDPEKPGSDIFIHGGCATVGCIPITDQKIAELYILVSAAYTQGQQQVPVHFFPFKLTSKNLTEHSDKYPQHTIFWQELKPVFDYFEQNRKLLSYRIDEYGKYKFTIGAE